jgi:hypothetical protein
VPFEFRAVTAAKSPDTLGEAIGSGGSDGPCSAHDHVADGGGSLLKITRAKNLEPMREKPLLDQKNFVPDGIEGDGSIMGRSAICGDVHEFQRNERRKDYFKNVCKILDSRS